MHCREVEELWDDIRGTCMASLKEAVHTHLKSCQACQELYEQYEGVAYRLSSLPDPEPSCDIKGMVVEHIAQIRHRARTTPIALTSLPSPIGRLFVGFKENRIVFIGIDVGDTSERVRERISHRLRRQVIAGEAPSWLRQALDGYFQTWHVDDRYVDLSDLTPFEQAALRAAASIPPGEVRSYAWVATKIGKPKAARAVGQVMARNPLPVLFPCHRVVDSSGALHNYGAGIEMKARLLKMEGYLLDV